MIKSIQLFLFLFSFGLLFTPNEGNACGKNKEAKTCELASNFINNDSKISHSKQNNNKTCNDKLTDSTPVSEKTQHDCDGHCNHNSCKCAAFSLSINLPQSIDFQINSCITISKNIILSNDENRLPSGFHSIWLPPVIS